jgi:triosephosphate isomerase (TIM)
MIRPFIAGNWKMHKTVGESVVFARLLCKAVADVQDRDVAIAPAFPSLYPVAEILKGTAVQLSAQNLCDQPEGALTGEVSARMLVEAGCSHVIIGHSERRMLFHEGDGIINRKMGMALRSGLKPIICVGETLREREADQAFSVITRQMKEGLHNISASDIGHCIVAYEPVWAIGTGRTATPEQARDVHVFIRRALINMYGEETADQVPILYGGSVNPGNIGSLMAQRDINGALIGGASLDVDSFSRIIHF